MFRRLMMTGWLLLLAAGTARALEPAQVVVLVNAKVPESVALGRFYCHTRQVSEDNLVALELPTGNNITPEDYDNKLAKPLREALAQRKLTDRVQCILTIRGVPFRLLERPRQPLEQLMGGWYASVGPRMIARVQEDLRLLEQVGQAPPAKAARATDLFDRDQWFDPPPTSTAPAGGITDAETRFWTQTRQKLLEVHRMATPEQADIARKQLLALSYDLLGLQGLLEATRLVTVEGAPSSEELTRRLKAQVERINSQAKSPTTQQSLADLEAAFRAVKGALGMHLKTVQQQTAFNVSTSQAAVDSELSLLFWTRYEYAGFLPNPLHWQHQQQRQAAEQANGGRVLMVSRLDAPEAVQVMRMIRDSLAAEKTGLKGTLYIDAGASPNNTQEYNQHLTALGEIVRRHTAIPVKLDNRPAVWGPDECPNAALYVGWYSLQQYVPSCQWVPGAVGFHVASWEAMHLRDPNSTEWVPRMIAGRVGATIGAADEPFLTAFPLAEEFFTLVLTGKLTVAEAYWRTVPNVSWRMMLFADPLYNPFGATPQSIPLPAGALPTGE